MRPERVGGLQSGGRPKFPKFRPRLKEEVKGGWGLS